MVGPGGTAINTTVLSGGALDFLGGAILSGTTTISSGGAEEDVRARLHVFLRHNGVAVLTSARSATLAPVRGDIKPRSYGVASAASTAAIIAALHEARSMGSRRSVKSGALLSRPRMM
jgi:hypothetical protein